MVLMEDPGRVLHPVDGDATERLWVEVRQLDLYFRKSLWCHIFNGGGGVGWRLMCNEDIFIPRYPPGVREGEGYCIGAKWNKVQILEPSHGCVTWSKLLAFSEFPHL